MAQLPIEVEKSRQEQLFRNCWPVLNSMMGASILVYALWHDGSHTYLLVWYAAMLAAAGHRFVMFCHWNRNPARLEALIKRRRQFIAMILIFALITASSLGITLTLNRPESPYFILLMIAGLSAGMVVMYSADLLAVVLFLGITSLSVLVTCFMLMIGDSNYSSAGLIMLFLGIGLIFTAKKSHDDLIGSFIIAHERQRLLQALSDAKADSDHASQAKSRFLATMTHELRTPLNAIMGFSEIIMLETFGPVGVARYKTYAQDIHASAEHLLALINDVLDAAKIEAGGYHLSEDVMDLADSIERVMRLIRGHAEQKKIAIGLDLAAKPYLFADERAIRQILLNLISNAVKFSKPNGKVDLMTRFDDGGNLIITVADQGIGIPADELQTLQTPFIQASNARSTNETGTGLGLAITRNLVQLHSGTLHLSSVLGKGTRADITLPVDRIRHDAVAMPPSGPLD